MDVFVYGTLRSEALQQAVAGGAKVESEAARFAGHSVMAASQAVAPILCVAPNDAAEGLVLLGLSQEQVHRLDLYQGVFGYARKCAMVQTRQGKRSVQVYMADAGGISMLEHWSFAKWQAGNEAAAVLAATEIFAYDPMLSLQDIRQRFQMIERRSWAKLRAQGSPQETTVRHHAKAEDVTIRHAYPPHGSFFAMQSVEVDYRQFDGTRSPVVAREVFLGVDAAIVLPYDMKRDRILLVEQMRMGAVMRQDPQPWLLEPIAGMVDGGETPEEAARRESAEEAQLHKLELRHIASFYPSPGSTTDYFYTYLGLCDLPDDHVAFGGLDAESEDLRLHLMGFEAALALVRSGEINAGPLVMMLYWLATQRDALRAAL